MTDAEIVKCIAEKVMGWKYRIHKSEISGGHILDTGVWHNQQGQIVVTEQSFNPLTDDNDCMMAWDRQEESVVSSKDRRRAMCLCMVKAPPQEPKHEQG